MVDISCLEQKKKIMQHGQVADSTEIRSPIWGDQTSVDRVIDQVTNALLQNLQVKHDQKTKRSPIRQPSFTETSSNKNILKDKQKPTSKQKIEKQ